MNAEPTSDPAARFLELLRPIETGLESYGRRLLWDPQQAPDAIHNAIARAIAAFDRYHEGTNFRAWMFTILTREVFALNRRHRRIAEHEFVLEPEEMAQLAGPAATGEPAADPLSNWEEAVDDRLAYALRTLADPERATLLLRAIGGFKYQEISEALEMPVGSVMGYLNRARQKMRQALVASRSFKSSGEL